MNKTLIIFLLILSVSGPLFSAEENTDQEVTDASIGINGNFGSFDLYKKNIEFENKPGLYTGGGISLEKKIYEKFWIGSGIQYRYFRTRFVNSMDTSNFNATWTFQSINVPLLMILQFSGPFSAIDLSCGAVYSHIFYSIMTTDPTLPAEQRRDNALKFIEANQIGATAGISFRIKATEYTDFVLGVTGEFYPTNLLIEHDESKDKFYMINYSLTTGWKFRTNIFPGSTKE